MNYCFIGVASTSELTSPQSNVVGEIDYSISVP